MNRRHFMQRALAAGLLARFGLSGASARATGPGQQLAILRLRHGGGFDANPGADTVLAEEIRLRTSVDIAEEPRIVPISSGRLFDSLFAILVGDGPVRFSDDERQNLKRWLGLGGLLICDNAGKSSPSPSFDASIRAELTKMFPQNPLKRVSPDHVLYRSFYRLDYPAGRAIHKPFVEGLTLGKRYAVVLNHNDLTGALDRDEHGGYRHTPTPGGENQREMAFRFGVNLMMYATCLHYKDDQVHIDYLLRKRKWKIRRPDGR